ncbi:hypothetical protein TSUD_296980 [Trifolium subterraneum]|nr:hypothetical protein TSUD_296980 [Trifolium subterraneum]
MPTLEPPLNVKLPIQDEIRSSTKQIEVPSVREQKLLQEEIDDIESNLTTYALPTSGETFLFMESIDASNSLTDALQVPKDFLTSKESTESSIVIDEDLVVHHLSSRREIQITPISKSVKDDASSDEIGVSAMTYMAIGSTVVSLPLFGDATHSFAADASLVFIYPYDPRPLDSPPLNKVSNIYDSFQLDQEVLTRILSQFDDPMTLQVCYML